MKLSDFDFQLPEERIAQEPKTFRDDSKLMVIDKKSGDIQHKQFVDFPNYFSDNDIIVYNNTKVFPALLHGKKEDMGSLIDVLLLRELNNNNRLWDVLVDPARKIRVGNKIFFKEDQSLEGEIVDNTTSRGRTLRFYFDGSDEDFFKEINEIGHVPLPPHIKRQPEAIDKERYQTIFAQDVGSVGAPEAGFHFTKLVMKRMELKGVHQVFLTLRIGIGGLHLIQVEDLSKHKMESEYMNISLQTATAINEGMLGEKKICSVGISTLRALETSVSTKDTLKPFDGWTNKFIYEPYQCKIANCLLTNFHQPRTPAFMTACAFVGYKKLKEAYNIAIENKYDFLTYGDAMLII